MFEELSNEDIDDIHEALDGLIMKGMVNIVGVNENGELLYQLSNKGKYYAENYGKEEE